MFSEEEKIALFSNFGNIFSSLISSIKFLLAQAQIRKCSVNLLSFSCKISPLLKSAIFGVTAILGYPLNAPTTNNA